MLKLNSTISSLPLVGPVYVKRLKKLEISTIEDLLYHVPSRYQDFRLVSDISRVQIGETVTIKCEIKSIINQYTKSHKKIQIAQVVDDSGEIAVIWFNQPYLVRTFRKGMEISFSGKVDWFGRKKALISPEHEIKGQGKPSLHTGRLVPIYPETGRLSSKWLRSRINYLLPQIKTEIKEFLPEAVISKHKLAKLSSSIEQIHFPNNPKEAESAKHRLAFDELLMLHLTSSTRKLDWQKSKVEFKLIVDQKEINNFIKSLPFTLTKSQDRTINEMLKDLKKDAPMNRLLEGDVGSGKTVVAAIACLVSFLNGYQSMIMAPTQILAQQHFETLNQIFKSYKMRIGLITSAGVKKDAGKIDVFVGTHALLHKKVKFDNIAVVVIDEQHRFGVEQRAHLTKTLKGKSTAPHILTMTATPIPRTIVLTVYGDLDLSTLDELPKGRKPITTWLVPSKKRQGAYKWIKGQIKEKGIQAFVICPLIEESEIETMSQVKAATVEFEALTKIFKNSKVGLLHGRQKVSEKNKVLEKFKNNKINILVSTPVVEVGIDIPNAAIMLIEAADRFGLAQLHQLRGRVGRGKHKSYCLLFTENRSPKVQARLSALQKMMSGFELAELDLKLRGPGEIFGTKQSGYKELKIAAWQDVDLIKKTKKVAEEAINNPKKFSKLFNKLKGSNIALN